MNGREKIIRCCLSPKEKTVSDMNVLFQALCVPLYITKEKHIITAANRILLSLNMYIAQKSIIKISPPSVDNANPNTEMYSRDSTTSGTNFIKASRKNTPPNNAIWYRRKSKKRPYFFCSSK